MGLDRSSIPKLTSHSEIIQELLSEIPEARDASENVTRLFSDCASETEEPWLLEDAVPSCLEDITREDMEIVLLGTGSSQPSKYRNVSSIFINLFSKGSILLDCGDGSLGQLKRRLTLHPFSAFEIFFIRIVFLLPRVIDMLQIRSPRCGRSYKRFEMHLDFELPRRSPHGPCKYPCSTT